MRRVQSSEADSTGASRSRVGLERETARFAADKGPVFGGAQCRTAHHQQPFKTPSGLKVQVVPAGPSGRGAASLHEIHSLSLEDEKATRWSCGQEARYAAPRTFPLARVTLRACREHTPILPVTIPTFIYIGKPFNGDSFIHLVEISPESVTYHSMFVSS